MLWNLINALQDAGECFWDGFKSCVTLIIVILLAIAVF